MSGQNLIHLLFPIHFTSIKLKITCSASEEGAVIHNYFLTSRIKQLLRLRGGGMEPIVNNQISCRPSILPFHQHASASQLPVSFLTSGKIRTLKRFLAMHFRPLGGFG